MFICMLLMWVSWLVLIDHLTPDAFMLLQEAGLATLKVVSKPGRITLPGHVAQIVRNLSGQDASNLVGRIRMLSDGDEEVRHWPARVTLHVLQALESTTACLAGGHYVPQTD